MNKYKMKPAFYAIQFNNNIDELKSIFGDKILKYRNIYENDVYGVESCTVDTVDGYISAETTDYIVQDDRNGLSVYSEKNFNHYFEKVD